MTEWFVISFDQVTEDGFKTAKVDAASEDEALQQAGQGFTIAFPVGKNATTFKGRHVQMIDEFRTARLLQNVDEFLRLPTVSG